MCKVLKVVKVPIDKLHSGKTAFNKENVFFLLTVTVALDRTDCRKCLAVRLVPMCI